VSTGSQTEEMAEGYSEAVSLVVYTIHHPPGRNKCRVLIRSSIEEDNIDALKVRAQLASTVKNTNEQLYQWIQRQYHNSAFTSIGFIGWGKFQTALISQKPEQQDLIISALKR
jgi:hypothetical protein